jgi:hypothetical protein
MCWQLPEGGIGAGFQSIHDRIKAARYFDIAVELYIGFSSGLSAARASAG